MSGRVVIAAFVMALSPTLHSFAQAQSAQADVPALKFADFFRHPIGRRGLEMKPALLAADGQRVRLVGYMVAQARLPVGRFMLTPRPVRMSEDADGEADDLPPVTVTVLLPEAQRGCFVAYRPGLIAVVGRLQVGRAEDGSGRVSWVRLGVDPDDIAIADGEGAQSKTSSCKVPQS